MMSEPQKSKKVERALTLRLPASWHKTLKIQAAEEERPMSDLIRDAVKERYSLPCECCEPPAR